jgi:hypothetical protein
MRSSAARAIVRGKVKPPKSKYGRRDVPLEAGLVFALRRWRKETEWAGDRDPIFPSAVGSPMNYSNTYRRILRSALEEVGVDGGFHLLRHTCASLLFARGANAVQVQRWLGHHSPAFTMSTYVHRKAPGVRRSSEPRPGAGAELARADVEWRHLDAPGGARRARRCAASPSPTALASNPSRSPDPDRIQVRRH